MVAVAAAFGGSLGAPFHLDDFALLQDPVVTAPDGWLRVWALPQTRPLTWWTFWANYALGGESPAGYHAVNLLLHLGNTLLLAAALRRWLSEPAAFAGALLFAVHPIQTEAVVYVFARATLLMTLFCLLSLRAWNRERFWEAATWFVPALLAKEECVAWPLFLVLLRFSAATRPAILAMLAMAALAGGRVLYAAGAISGSGAGAGAAVSSVVYLQAQGVALWRYARLLVLPYGFTIESPVVVDVWGWVGWVAIGALVLWAIRRHPRSLWMLAALMLIAPSSSVLPADDLAADRRVYLPLVALAAAVGPVLARWRALPLALGLLWTGLSIRETLQWRQPARLWREAATANPQRVRPWIQWARQLPPAEALRVLDEARRMAPENPAIAAERGRVLLESGDAAGALREFGTALALAPEDARAVHNRGAALLRLGQRDAAIADFHRALRLDPCLFDAHWNLKNLGVPAALRPDCRYTPRQRALLESH